MSLLFHHQMSIHFILIFKLSPWSQLYSLVFWVFTRRIDEVGLRCFGTPGRFHLQSSRFETLFAYLIYTPCKTPKTKKYITCI